MSWIHTALLGILWGGPIALLAAALDVGRNFGNENRVAFGDIAVAAALLAIGLGDGGIVSIAIGLIVAVPFLAALGAVVRWLIVDRTSLSDPARTVLPLVAMLGVAAGVRAIGLDQTGGDRRSLDLGSLHSSAISTVSGNSVSQAVIVAFLVSIVAVVLLDTVVARTPVGRDLRAVSDDPERAQLLGLDLRTWAVMGIALSVLAGGLGAVLYAAQRPIDSGGGPSLLIVAFEALVIGGAAARIRGPVFGGLAVGLLTALGERWVPGYGPILTGVAFLLALVAMPDGLAAGVHRPKEVAA